MTRTKSILGAAFLSAVCLCSFGVANASATTAHECLAVALGTSQTFNDANCTEKNETGTGKFRTTPISLPATVRVTHTSNFTLSATIGGVFFSITCTGLEAKEATMSNGEAGGAMFVSGEGKSVFTGCSVTAPAGKGCTVPATIETVNLTSKTEDLAGEVMKMKFTPKAGETFVIIKVTGCSVGALNGEKAVTGSAKAVQTDRTSFSFTTTSGSELKLGGQAAVFTGTYHFSTTDANKTPIYFETP